jgi:outer membrane autotransporter protein
MRADGIVRGMRRAAEQAVPGTRIRNRGETANAKHGRHRKGELLALSCVALAIAGTLPRMAAAEVFVVVNESQFRAAISNAALSSDASSTIVLGSGFQVGSTALPTVSKDLTIDTQGFTITGVAGGSIQWPNGTGTQTFIGTLTGGNASGVGAAAGVGMLLNGLSFVNNGTISGGDATGGGTSGSGAQVRRGTTLTNNGTIEGGNVDGGNAANSAGVDIGGAPGNATLINSGMIRGGSDLTGATAGGPALLVRNGTQSVVNTGTLVGGNDAVAITVNSGGLSLINSGTIQAGSGQANAIQFSATTLGSLTLELRAGSVIAGNVVANAVSSSNTLILGGTANDIFDVSSIGNTAQYRNFNTFEKTGTSTWALTGTGVVATAWSIQQGTLQIGNGGTSGSLIGDIADNGTLAFNRSDSLTFDNVVSGTGSLSQVGTGTTILTAANSYTGGTNVMAGTLAAGDGNHAGASLGTGLTTVAAGATLGGYGLVPGSVNNGGTVAAANALRQFASGNTGTFRIAGDLNNAGIVNLAAASGQIGNVLSVGGNYSGSNGQVVLNTVLNQGGAASQSDQLVVGGNASGSTAIKVNRSGGGSGALTVGDGIQLVQVNGTSVANSFHLSGPIQAGAYQYLLYQGGAASANDWYLRSEFEAPTQPGENGASSTSPANGAAVAGAIAYRPAVTGYSVTPLLTTDYGFAVLGRLHERVGDIANAQSAQPDTNKGVWGRFGGQNLDADAGDRFSADEHTFFAQFGKDWTLSRSTDGGSTHAGATLTFGSTSASFSDSMRSIGGQLPDSTGTVETQAQSIGGYWTKYLPDGSYVDGVGQLTHYQNKYGDIYGDSASQNGFGAGVSGEAGKPFALGSTGAAIEPQVQLLYQYLHLNHFDDGISPVGANTSNALRGRVGFRLFKADLSNDSKTSTVTPDVTADVLHDFFSPGQTSVGGTSFQNELGKTWYELGIGITGSFGPRSELYANVKYARNMGGDYRRTVFGQAGYRYSW